jgi:hypothetical protein
MSGRCHPESPFGKAVKAVLDKVRVVNAHLSEAELDVKLREARDEYCREIREKDMARARWVLDTAK